MNLFRIPPYHFIDIDDQDYMIIPYNMIATKLYSFKVEGGRNLTIIKEDSEFCNLISCLGASINQFIKLHRETHAMTEPFLCITPDGIISAKIGIMEIEEFNEKWKKLNAASDKENPPP